MADEQKKGSGGALTVLLLCIALAGVGAGSGILGNHAPPQPTPVRTAAATLPRSHIPDRPQPAPDLQPDDASDAPAPVTSAPPVEVFDAAWNAVNANYFDRDFGGVDWEAMRERYRPIAEKADNSVVLYQEAIRPMLASLHSSHLTVRLPRDAKAPPGYEVMREGSRRGDTVTSSFGGGGDIGGVTIVFDGGQWVVTDVKKGSPAERAGVGPGRRMAKSRVALVEAGPPARYHAELSFIRSDGGLDDLSYDYVADPYAPQHVETTLASGVRLIRFDVFDAATIDWAIDQIRAAGPPGVIIDLRANPGGQLGAFRRIAAEFLPAGAPLGKSVGRDLTVPAITPTSLNPYSGPAALLIGPRTMSAAEMLAEAMRHYKRAVLVGDRTAGAALTARFFNLPDGGRLTVATGDYIAPDGGRLEGRGVTPDILQPQTLEAVRAGHDATLDAAEQALLQPR